MRFRRRWRLTLSPDDASAEERARGVEERAKIAAEVIDAVIDGSYWNADDAVG